MWTIYQDITVLEAALNTAVHVLGLNSQFNTWNWLQLYEVSVFQDETQMFKNSSDGPLKFSSDGSLKNFLRRNAQTFKRRITQKFKRRNAQTFKRRITQKFKRRNAQTFKRRIAQKFKRRNAQTFKRQTAKNFKLSSKLFQQLTDIKSHMEKVLMILSKILRTKTNIHLQLSYRGL